MNFNRLQKAIRFFGVMPKSPFRYHKIYQQGSYILMKKISTIKQWTPAPAALLGFLSFFKKVDPVKEEFLSVMKKSSNLIDIQDYAKAEKYLERALELAKKLESVDYIADVYDAMGNSALRQNNLIRARQQYNRELKVLKTEGYQEENIKILRTRVKIAYVRQRQGKCRVSKNEYKEIAGKIQMQLNSEDKNNIELLELLAFAKNQLGHLLLETRQYVEAKMCFADAYDAYYRAYDRDNIEIIDVLCNMSQACQLCEDQSAAIKFLEKALRTAERLQDEIEAARIKAEIGALCLKTNLVNNAKKNCGDALKVGIKHDNKVIIVKATSCLQKIKEIDKKKETLKNSAVL